MHWVCKQIVRPSWFCCESCRMASHWFAWQKTCVAELTVELWIEWFGRALANWDQSRDNLQVLRDGRNEELGLLLLNIQTCHCHNDLLFNVVLIIFFICLVVIFIIYFSYKSNVCLCFDIYVFIYLFIYLFILVKFFSILFFLICKFVDIYFFTICTHFINVSYTSVLLR